MRLNCLSPMTARIFLNILIGISLVCTDQWLKIFARTHPAFSAYIRKPWIGWEYFENTGVAFGLPVPLLFVLFATPLFLAALVWFGWKHKKSALLSLGTVLILFGALSNYLDRLQFGFTIDYLRIATGVINLADISIAVGALLLLFKKNPAVHTTEDRQIPPSLS